ncbi:hypothetical protein KCP76_21800 [Salmonella enterica subsp. enterica serovar Weltevreden]|nr:hypothetical protein KCP76_21800 [Salmonella enterica subsp. enterica serovar Weltevreden]
MPVLNYRRLNSGYVHSATDVLRPMDVSRAEEDCRAVAHLITKWDIMPVTDFNRQTPLARSRRILARDESHGLLKAIHTLLHAQCAVCRADVSG